MFVKQVIIVEVPSGPASGNIASSLTEEGGKCKKSITDALSANGYLA